MSHGGLGHDTTNPQAKNVALDDKRIVTRRSEQPQRESPIGSFGVRDALCQKQRAQPSATVCKTFGFNNDEVEVVRLPSAKSAVLVQTAPQTHICGLKPDASAFRLTSATVPREL